MIRKVKNIDTSHNFLYLFDFFIQMLHYQQRLIAEIYIDTKETDI